MISISSDIPIHMGHTTQNSILGCAIPISVSLSKDSVFILICVFLFFGRHSFYQCISFFKYFLFLCISHFSHNFLYQAYTYSSNPTLLTHCRKYTSISQQCGVRKRGEGRLLCLRKVYFSAVQSEEKRRG